MKNFALIILLLSNYISLSQIEKAPERFRGEGPFNQLIIRGATLINGNGAPPTGPVDIVIEKNVITSIRNVGYPGLEINEKRRPVAKSGSKEIDAHGKYVLPGFIDMHGHISSQRSGTAEYVFKLWMAHGITTIRDPSCGQGLDWVLNQKEESKKNNITAPRILAYTSFGQGASNGINTIQEAINWVRKNAEKGADGIKFFGSRPDIFKAALQENKRLGLRSACHHAQMDVSEMNVLETARNGLTTMEHWYGLPEALFEDKTVQNYPLEYNYMNEGHRFEEAGKLWKQAAKPYSKKWNEVMNELISLDFTIDVTFVPYSIFRDVQRGSSLPWHKDYTRPKLLKFFLPARDSHAAAYYDWGSELETEWKENYKLWMIFINEYKNRGGRVTAGADSGYMYNLYGFGYVQELELLRESGFHPMEVIRAGTLHAAEAIGMEDKIGSVEVGKLADLIIMDQNPLKNLKYLYATGDIKLEDNKVIRVGGIDHTIKDGIIYNAKKLLSDVKEIVDKEKEENPGWEKLLFENIGRKD
jgi:dihydroorotase-like cyclic amidohydrolase